MRQKSPRHRPRLERLEPRTLLSTVSWINPYSGDWNTPANWSSNAVPSATSDVIINQPGFIKITLTGNATVASLSVTGDTLLLSGGNLTTATVNNAGILTLNFNSHLIVSGALTQNPTSALSLISGSNSTVSAASISNSGKITIGATDSLTAATFSQNTNGTLATELAGANSAGVLHVTAAAQLAGRFEANLTNNYSPSINDHLTPITFPAATGAFTTWQLANNANVAFHPALSATALDLTALSTAQPTTTIQVGAVLHDVATNIEGVNLGWWDPSLLTAKTQQLVTDAGLNIFRFPGGGSSDAYHFFRRANYRPDEITVPQFAQFIENVGGVGMVTLDYGSGSPQESEAELAYLLGSPADSTVIGNGITWSDAASQWQTVDWHTVGYWAGLRAAAPLAQDDGLNFLRINRAAAFSNIKYWEVGNELYGGWEPDHHGINLPDSTPTGADHDPVTYVQFANSFANFVNANPASFPPISIGIDSWDPAGVFDNNWTRRVLTAARNVGFTPGYISDHSYMQSPGAENDSTLLNNSDTDPNSQYNWIIRYANYQNLLYQTLGATGAGVQVMATEYNSVITQPGKQLTSLVNGLFLADALGTLLTSNYSAGITWMLRDFYNGGGNNSPSLYGWRQGGDYGLLGDLNRTSLPATGAYVPYPSYFAQQLGAKLVRPGGQVVSSVSSNTQFSTYAVLQANGHLTLLVINKNPSTAVTEQFKIAGFSANSAADIWQYGITQDTAQSQTADGASSLDHFSANLTLLNGAFTYTLPAYSMTVLDLAPAAAIPPPTIDTPAGVRPGPNNTLALSVLGADAGAGGESALQYFWSTTSLPAGAPLPTFSETATNHSKNTTATLYAAGAYTFTVTIRRPGGPSVTSSISLAVAPTLAQILVTKTKAALANGASEALAAIAYDQFNNPLPVQPAFTWSVPSGGGAITPAGLYTAPASGTGPATITATSGTVEGSATVSIVAAAAKIIDYPNGFSTVPAGELVLNGAAALRASKLVLIDDALFQSASAYYAAPVNIQTFSTQFSFHLNNAWPMANGFTFVIQNAGPLAIGGTGAGLGYNTIPKSVAIKFDLYNTFGSGSTGLYVNGADPSKNSIELGQNGFNLRSWDPSQATITYDGATLTVVLTDLFTNATATQTYSVNIPALIGSNTAWVGFTAGSASMTTAQSITAWTYSNTLGNVPAAPTALATTPGDGTIALRWNAAAGASTYAVKYGTAPGTYANTLTNITATGVTIPGLVNGTKYYFIVLAANAIGSSANSAELSATPTNAVVRIVDDNDAGFTKTGTWGTSVEPGIYFGNDHSYAKSGNGANVATYTFTSLPAGIYRVSATWRGDTNRATKAPFTIADGPTVVGTITINQQLAPASFTDQGSRWGDLGTFTIAGGTVIVTLRDTADAALYVDADAIRAERIGDIPPPTAPAAPTGLAPIAGDTQVSLTWSASPGATRYTLRYGTAAGIYTNTLANLNTPAATVTGLSNGTNYFFAVTASNTIGESANSAEVSATPAAAPPPPPTPVIAIIDDNDAGFTKTGTWGSSIEPGLYYGNDHSYAKSGNGANIATYTFTNLPTGVYRVSATWRGDTNRATAAPFSVFDGITLLGTVTLNQQKSPNNLLDQNTRWGDLGTFNLAGSTLVVTLRDTADANLYVDADAVRIERLGNLGYTPPPPNPVFYADDRSANWSAQGAWGNTFEPGHYFGNGHSYAINGHGADIGTWTFTSLTPGVYRVAATWRNDTNRATNAPFTVLDGATPLATVIVNQQIAPSSFNDAGSAWQTLGTTFRITGTTLAVRLTDNADLYVDADAIRIERIGD